MTVRAVAGGLPAPDWLAHRGRGDRDQPSVTRVTDELHQMFVPGRSAQLTDLLADAIGVVAGAGLCWAWGLMARQRHEPAASRDV